MLLLSLTVADADLWGHVRFGLDNLEAGSILRADRYSYLTAGQRWINHEWLSEVLLAAAWKLLGSTGLVVLKMLIGLGTLGIVAAFLRSRGVAPTALALLLLMGAALLSFDFATVRPQVFTVLCFAAMLLLILQAGAGAGWSLWWLAPLFAVWTNLHGGVLSGAAVLLAWGALKAVLEPRSAWRVAPPITAAVAATLFNPYGPALPLFLLKTATIPRPEIWEWNPIQVYAPYGMLYVALMLVCAAGLVFSRRERSFTLTVLFACMVAAPLVARRHVALFAVAALMICGEHIADAFGHLRRPRSRGRRSPGWATTVAIVIVAALLLAAAFNAGRIRVPPLYPWRAVGLLRMDPSLQANLAAEFSWGEYLIWHLGPKVKVSIDGRRETLYSPAVYTHSKEFLTGRKGWDVVLEKFPTDLALVTEGSPTSNLLSLKPDWRLVYRDEVSALFVRRSGELESKMARLAATYVAPKTRPLHFP